MGLFKKNIKYTWIKTNLQILNRFKLTSVEDIMMLLFLRQDTDTQLLQSK